MTPVMPRLASRSARLLLLLLLLTLPGCLSEENFPPHWDQLVHLTNPDHLATRDWTARMHQAAAGLLPRGHDDALTTDQLTTDDTSDPTPVDVWKHFNLDPNRLDNIFYNLRGIEQSAQTVSPTASIDHGRILRPAWQGFQEIEVPVNGISLYARIGSPDPQNEIPGSWIIFTHGLFGSLDGKDVNNHVQALRHAGHHVLAIEMRGHGQTFLTHPNYPITFGIEESGDLLAAAVWLKQTHGATRVGLVSFSLTGFESLLTAWLDGTTPVTEFNAAPFGKLLPRSQIAPAFNGGIMVISAPIGVMDVATRFETHYSLLEAPAKATFQAHIAKRLDYFKCGPGFTLWDLARCEFSHSDLRTLYPSFAAAQPDLQDFLDLSQDNWRTGAARMENIRVPLLLLNSANDPLASAQGLANLFSRQQNPNIGVILLREGGHIGFTAFAADYYYSVMLNFFDPASAPAIG